MKTVAENYATQALAPHRSADDTHGVLLGRIGEGLRDLYGEVVEAEPPRPLVELARRLDAQREWGGPES